MNRLLIRCWHSPTLTTWSSFLVRTLSLVLVVPLVLRNFSAGDAALWFVFSSVLAMQALVGFGFGPTFARMIAYARGGLPVEAMRDLTSVPPDLAGRGPDWEALGRLWRCMKTVFALLAVISFLLLATAGTAAVWKSVGESSDTTRSWVAWITITVGTAFAMGGATYSFYLLGIERIALLRRLETAASFATIFVAFVVLLAGGGILALILSNQLCSLAGVGIIALAGLRAESGALRRLPASPWDPVVFSLVWSAAWKHGVASLMTTGIVQSTTLIQAQFGSPVATATYAFNLKIATIIGQLAQAPFVSKLPTIARLMARGTGAEPMTLLRRGMAGTHATVVLGTVAYALIAPTALKVIGSKSVDFDPLLWALFALNIFFERYTAMLQQVKNLTNRPAEHWGTLGFGLITIVCLCISLPLIGEYAFPLSMLVAQLLFAFWFGALVGYRALKVNPINFELGLALPSFAAVLCLAAILIWTGVGR